MSEILELDYESQSLAEYALAAWERMTEAGFAPLDSLMLIEKQLRRRQKGHPSIESEQALRLICKWRAMMDAVRMH